MSTNATEHGASQKTPVLGYVRVSKVGGREGDSFISPELQREQIEAVARREGLHIVAVIEELDASGGDANRPGWNRAIEMVGRWPDLRQPSSLVPSSRHAARAYSFQ